jgi:hypothetical protein
LLVFLVATYPVAFLWSINIGASFPVSDVLIAWAITLGFAGLVYAIARAATRDTRAAALLTSVIVIAVTTFGHLARWIGISPATAEERWLLAAYSLLVVAGAVVAISRGNGAPDRLFLTANLVIGVLVVMNLAGVAGGGAAREVEAEIDVVQALDTSGWAWAEDGQPRDIYYLIFDRYANEAVLREQYGFDNSAFLDGLRDDGFRVVDEAMANYPQTAHSLASSLNMTHLDGVAEAMGPDSSDFGPIWRSLSDSTVVSTFDDLGYTTVHVGTWWEPSRVDPGSDINIVEGAISEFQSVLLNTTVWPALARTIGVDTYDFRRQEFRRIGSQFQAIEETSRDPRPTFTFAHFTLPHPPYVLNADGSFSEDAGRPIEAAYLEQLEAANTMISDLVDHLLTGPDDTDPIVIVQSDEGPYPVGIEGTGKPIVYTGAPDEVVWRKLAILNAYYLPGQTDAIYDEITPVNTFRMVFDRYFGSDLGLLPDRAFIYADRDHPYRLTEVTDRVRAQWSS